MKKLIVSVIALVVLFIIGSIVNNTHTKEYKDVKVIKLEQQSLLRGSKNSMHTEIRYLVITNKGTFICESNAWENKFNNSDIFYRLVEGKTYSKFKVTGFGKGLFYDYQNIVDVEGL